MRARRDVHRIALPLQVEGILPYEIVQCPVDLLEVPGILKLNGMRAHRCFRRDGGNVWLAPDTDTDKFPVLPREGAEIVSVPAAALRRALDAAMRVMTAVEARLDQALTGVLPDHLRAPAIDLMLNGYNGRYDELRERDQKQA